MKLLKFANDLLSATNDGKVPWKDSCDYNDEYVASAGKYNVSIGYRFDEDSGTGYYALSVTSGRNQVGRIIFNSNEEHYGLLQKMFLAAQAEANNIDDAIDNISDAFKL